MLLTTLTKLKDYSKLLHHT